MSQDVTAAYYPARSAVEMREPLATGIMSHTFDREAFEEKESIRQGGFAHKNVFTSAYGSTGQGFTPESERSQRKRQGLFRKTTFAVTPKYHNDPDYSIDHLDDIGVLKLRAEQNKVHEDDVPNISTLLGSGKPVLMRWPQAPIDHVQNTVDINLHFASTHTTLKEICQHAGVGKKNPPYVMRLDKRHLERQLRGFKLVNGQYHLAVHEIKLVSFNTLNVPAAMTIQLLSSKAGERKNEYVRWLTHSTVCSVSGEGRGPLLLPNKADNLPGDGKVVFIGHDDLMNNSEWCRTATVDLMEELKKMHTDNSDPNVKCLIFKIGSERATEAQNPVLVSMLSNWRDLYKQLTRMSEEGKLGYQLEHVVTPNADGSVMLRVPYSLVKEHVSEMHSWTNRERFVMCLDNVRLECQPVTQNGWSDLTEHADACMSAPWAKFCQLGVQLNIRGSIVPNVANPVCSMTQRLGY